MFPVAQSQPYRNVSRSVHDVPDAPARWKPNDSYSAREGLAGSTLKLRAGNPSTRAWPMSARNTARPTPCRRLFVATARPSSGVSASTNPYECSAGVHNRNHAAPIGPLSSSAIAAQSPCRPQAESSFTNSLLPRNSESAGRANAGFQKNASNSIASRNSVSSVVTGRIVKVVSVAV